MAGSTVFDLYMIYEHGSLAHEATAALRLEIEHLFSLKRALSFVSCFMLFIIAMQKLLDQRKFGTDRWIFLLVRPFDLN